MLSLVDIGAGERVPDEDQQVHELGGAGPRQRQPRRGVPKPCRRPESLLRLDGPREADTEGAELQSPRGLHDRRGGGVGLRQVLPPLCTTGGDEEDQGDGQCVWQGGLLQSGGAQAERFLVRRRGDGLEEHEPVLSTNQ